MDVAHARVANEEFTVAQNIRIAPSSRVMIAMIMKIMIIMLIIITTTTSN